MLLSVCFVCSNLSLQVFVCRHRDWCVLALPLLMSRFFSYLLNLLTHSDFRPTIRHRGKHFLLLLHQLCFHCFWSVIFLWFSIFFPGLYFPSFYYRRRMLNLHKKYLIPIPFMEFYSLLINPYLVEVSKSLYVQLPPSGKSFSLSCCVAIHTAGRGSNSIS